MENLINRELIFCTWKIFNGLQHIVSVGICSVQIHDKFLEISGYTNDCRNLVAIYENLENI